ncbi:MAG: flagellar motor protein MotB [Planctomycetota bacterium]
MARRQKKAGPGVPEWVVTFGDMMSLLLCFFILLAAFSELKREVEYQRVLTAVKEAFGYSGGVGVMPTDDPPTRSMIELLESVAQQELKESKVSHSPEQGITGRRTKVSKVPEGTMFTIGGHLTFEPGSAELRETAKDELIKVANLLRGRNNKIAVRGHAAKKLLPADSPFSDLVDLSYFRGKAVADFLIEEGGLEQRVVFIEARGTSEPLNPRQFTPEAQTQNRRVEVIMTEIMVGDVNRDADLSSESAARGLATPF